jgi:hypothetical protein
VSYDTNLYLNESSETFCFSNSSISISEVWDFTLKKGDFIDGNRNNFIHLFACNANRFGIDIDDTTNFASNYTCSSFDINEIERTNEIANFLPGSYTEYNLSSKVFSKWIIKTENCKYYHYNMSRNLIYEPNDFIITVKSNLIQIVTKICDYLLNKKYIFTCILNQDITSTLLIWSICEYYKNINVENIQINTYCIGNEQCHIYNRNIINNLKQKYLLNICYTEVLIENNEDIMTPLFIKIKEIEANCEPDTMNYVFSDIGALELFYEKDCNIIDYKCNIKNVLEKMKSLRFTSI